MALKLKQYTDTYWGLDADFYLSREAPIITIITNRNTGKTTNILGTIAASGKGFMILVRYKAELPYAISKLADASALYGVEIKWNKKLNAFTDSDGKEVGYIAALSGAQDVKNQAEKFHFVEFIVFDEFLPTDRRYIKETTHPGYELEALRWIIGSVRKGGNGEIHRNIKVVLLANLVDAINPYFSGILDSKGTSLLTHLARAVHDNQTNFTLDDSDVFLTVHIDRRFEANDALGKFVNGYQENGLATGFLQDFTYHVRPKNKNILKQLKKPLICTGTAEVHLIRLATSIEVSGNNLDFDFPVYYWIPSNKQPSPVQEFNSIDFREFHHWYSDILTKAHVLDFFKNFNLQFKK